MRRVVSLCLGALACVAFVGAGVAHAEDPTTTTTAAPSSTTVRPTTTAVPPVTIGNPASTTTTTAKPGTATTTTTAKATTGKPVPPPPSGTSQTLVPSILGGNPVLDTSTTLFGVETVTVPTQPTNGASDDPLTSVAVATSKKGPNGTTLVLAAVAWLASLGGLLVYAEDQRGLRWRHLAR